MDGLFPDPEIDWQNCQHGSDVTKCGCCTEDNMIEVGKAIKEIDPTTTVIAYHHSYIAYPMYRNGQKLYANSDWWARDEQGEVVHWNTEDEIWNFWDHYNLEATNAWEEGCLAMTKTGAIDGCFFDGCPENAEERYINHHAENEERKKQSMIDLQTKTTGPCICGSSGHVVPGIAASQVQNWGKQPNYSTREIPMLMKAVEDQVMFQAHSNDCPTDATDQHTINNIASFLIAAGPYSYYMCGGWTKQTPTWYPIYDMSLGEPLSNAVK